MGTQRWIILTQLLLSGAVIAHAETRPAFDRARARDRDVAPSSDVMATKGGGRVSSDGWTAFPISRGEMTAIAVDPLDDATVYVGTRDAGVFKTTDAAVSWYPARDGLSYYPARSLVVDTTDPDILYVGTDFDGVWKSTDGGASWFQPSTDLPTSLIVLVLVIDPSDHETLLAGLAGGQGLAVGNIYKSVDGGQSWVRSDTGVPGTGDRCNGIRTLAFDLVNPDRIYAGTTYAGIYRSIDEGQTWSAVNTGIPGDGGYSPVVGAMATDPHHSHRACAVVEGLIDGGYYCLGADDVWTRLSTLYELTSGSRLLFHPSNPQILLTAGGLGGRVMKSTDGGVSWNQSLGHPDTGHVADVAFSPSLPQRLFAAGDIAMSSHLGGVSRSTDLGATWSLATEGIYATAVRSVATDPNDSATLFVGTGTGALLYSTDGGSSWSRTARATDPSDFTLGFEIADVAVDPGDSDLVYVAGFGLHLSTDGGATIDHENLVDNPTCIAIAPDGSGTVWVGTSFGGGVIKGAGLGPWAPVNTGLPSFGGSLNPILSIALDPSDAATAWVGTQYGGGILQTTDGGASWHSKGLTESNEVDAIAVDPTDSNTVLAGAGTSSGSIFRTTNGGASWQTVVSGIGFVMDFQYDPGDPLTVYAASELSGVLRSTDGGVTWSDFSDGIFYPVVYSLAVTADPDWPWLITGSYGSGASWRTIPGPGSIFRDGFESGGSMRWPGTSP